MELLRERVKNYLDSTPEVVVDFNNPASMRAPIQTLSRTYIPVDKIPASTDDLPFIPERKRDFAFRYATEFRPVQEWSEIYRVHAQTIRKWLTDSRIQLYIALVRLERRFHNMARWSRIEHLVYSRLESFLTEPITGSNADAMARVLELSLKLIRDPESLRPGDTRFLNQNVFVNSAVNHPNDGFGSGYGVPSERNITPTTKQVEELQARVDQVRMLNEMADEMSKNGEL